jgi:hypothetical protein
VGLGGQARRPPWPTWMRVCFEKPITPLASRYVPHAHTAPSSVSTQVWLSPAGSEQATRRRDVASTTLHVAEQKGWPPTA